MFLVKYKVDGFPGEHTAGPYSEIEAQSHRDDIAGFEGVHGAIIVRLEQSVLDKLSEAFNA